MIMRRCLFCWMRTHTVLVTLLVVLGGPEAWCESTANLLISQGQSNYVVVIPAEAKASERRAAEELCEHLRQMTGVVLPVMEENVYREDLGSMVSIGRTERSRAVLADEDFSGLGDEGFVVQCKGKHLFILGGRQRGTLYGVFEFLESLGVRWYTPKFSVIPKRKAIPLPETKTRAIPKCFYRDQFWNNGSDEAWRARMRLNGEHALLSEEWGNSTTKKNACHSYHALVPPGLFEKHPEWFAVKEDGKRRAGRPKQVHLCTTNEKLREHMVQTVRAQLKADPSIDHYWVSQDDFGRSGCFCEVCTAERNRHGGPDRWSANTMSLVNHVARAIKADYPKVWIKTLAYSYSVKAPDDLLVEDNVLVVLCGPSCTFHGVDQCEGNAPFLANLKQWTSLCGGIQTYFYGGPNYGYLWPYPSWFAMCRDYPVAYASGVRAMYRQGAAIGYGSEFTELRAYLSARMAWDPHADYRTIYREFMDAYYGPASPHIREYMEWYAKRCQDENIHSKGFWGQADAWKHWVDDEVMRVGERCFREALDAVAGAES
jgi:uncharacterized protein DUF4838/glycosyl hydrolase family 67